jgi:hypothetical protein
MNTPLTRDQMAKRFDCTVEQVRVQYAKNAVGLRQMHAKAVRTGKPVNGYTAEKLAEMVGRYDALAG